jgi:NHL repeat
MRYSQIAVRSTISFCLVSVLGFTILLNATQNSIAIPFQESYRFAGSWGAQGIKDGQFDLPHSLAIDISGNIYVTDTGNNRVEKNFIMKEKILETLNLRQTTGPSSCQSSLIA